MTESSESQSTASDVTVLEAAVGFSDPDLDLLLLLFGGVNHHCLESLKSKNMKNIPLYVVLSS